MTETITRHICEMIKVLREEFKALQFDFHSCFYYEENNVINPETQEEENRSYFKLHRKYQLQDDV